MPSRLSSGSARLRRDAGSAVVAMLIVAGLALSAAAGGSPAPEVIAPEDTLGADALTTGDPIDWGQVRTVQRMTPLPADAGLDHPLLYDSDPACQVAPKVVEPVTCDWGRTDSRWTVMIVGDSKVAQWQPTLELLAQDEGWRIVQLTKSGCPLTDSMRVYEDRAWTECREWGRAALRTILDTNPDLVLTSHRAPSSVADDWAGSGGPSVPLMVEGLVRDWSTITEANIPLGVILDNPSPPIETIPECVAEHRDDLRACAYGYDDGLARSAAPAQVEAARRVPGVGVVDMAPVLCPDGEVCPPVIGNVLLYRQGSHITRTYAESAREHMAAELRRITDGQFGRG